MSHVFIKISGLNYTDYTRWKVQILINAYLPVNTEGYGKKSCKNSAMFTQVNNFRIKLKLLQVPFILQK